jgi:hypothetical protein
VPPTLFILPPPTPPSKNKKINQKLWALGNGFKNSLGPCVIYPKKERKIKYPWKLDV